MLSTRAPPAEDRQQLSRQRPKTLHVRQKLRRDPTFQMDVPALSINESSPVTSNGKKRNELLCPQLLVVNDPAFEHKEHTEGRRESVLTMLNRIWKSDESTRRPAVFKSKTLDVPMEPLSRQLSLSETNVPASLLSSLPSKLTLTPRQKKLLKSSFANMNSGGTFLKLMEQVFRRLEVKFPDMRSIFLTTAFVNSLSRERTAPMVKTEHDHCKCLVAIFERIIDNLDNINEQLAIVKKYGEKHAQMIESGFTGPMIEQFGEIAVSVIGSQEVVKFNHDAVKAWRLLLACVTDEMKVGFERMSKINERRNSFNPTVS